MPTFALYSSRRRKKAKSIKNVFEEIMAENFPNLNRETYPAIRVTEGPKNYEPEKTHTKIYHN